MKNKGVKKIAAVSFLALAGLCLAGCSARNSAPASTDELQDRFEAALQTGDTNAIFALYYRSGTNDMSLPATFWSHALAQYLSDHSTNDLHASSSLLPLPQNFETESVINGIRFRPDVTILGMIDGRLPGWNIEIPYGKRGGHFYLAGTTRERIYEPKVKEMAYSIAISSTNFTVPTAYSLAVIYTQNGKDVEKHFTGTNWFHSLFWGNELKSCVLKKTSGDNNSLKIEIREGLTNKLFDSETTPATDTIAYKGSPS